jgi:SH3 domain-containing YSC84-like protein 1
MNIRETRGPSPPTRREWVRFGVALAATIALCAAVLGVPTARAEGLQDDVDQAASILGRFGEIKEGGIPEKVLADAKGLAILTVVKAGFLVSGEGGKGVVVARTSGGGWSGPSGIGTGGAGFGFQVGAQVTEFVIVLNTPAAVEAFAKGGNVSIGAELSAAAGPVGRNLGAAVMPVAAVYTYSLSQGLFAGMSLEGTVIVARDETTDSYYGRDATPAEILAGKVKPPAGAAKLETALRKIG